MVKYIIRRVALMIPILLVVSFLAFMFIHLTPSDPIRIMYGPEIDRTTYLQIRQQMGLDDPLLSQYVRYIGGVLKGDYGISYRTKGAVGPEIGRRLGNTITLALVSMVWAVVIGITVGIVSAVKRNSLWDRVGMVTTVALISMPGFWFGLLTMQIFAVQLGWFPTSGMGGIRHMILPSFTLGTGIAAVIARFTRSSLLETLQEDYVRTARAKGQKRWLVIWQHALRNALIPVVTMTGIQFGFLIGGSVVVERVFAWPGLGSYLIDSILTRDYPVVQALILLFSLQFLLVNLLVDVAYAYLNPQICLE